MTAVSVAHSGTRLDDAEAATGWLAIGGGQGASAEPSFAYQGTNLVNRKVTGTGGFYYEPTSDSQLVVDMTSSVLLAKVAVTDYAGLQAASGVTFRIGSGTGAYHVYTLAGTDSPVSSFDTYPARGGFLFVPIDPNIAAVRTSTTGSPTLTSCDYFGTVADFVSSTAKSENVGCDALDLDPVLTITGGGSPDPSATFQDAVNFDEGTTGNRWAGATASATGPFILCPIVIGTATAVDFNDTDRVTWGDHLAGPNWLDVAVDLQNASSTVTFAGSYTGLGSSEAAESRPSLTTTGTSGTLLISGQFANWNDITLTSAAEVTGIIECVSMTQATAHIHGATIRTLSTSAVACLTDPTFGTTTDLHDTAFVQAGTGHALEIDTVGTYTFTGLTFTGYGADTANDAAVFVSATSGTVTINVSGGDTPTVRSAGATVVVQNAVTVSVTALDAADATVIQSARVRLTAAAGGDLTVGTVILDGLTDVSGRIEDTGFQFTNPQPVTGRVRKGSATPFYKTANIGGTITAAGFDGQAFLVRDE